MISHGKSKKNNLPLFFSHDPRRPKLRDQFSIDGRSFPVNFSQAATIYLLMAGGIEDVDSLAVVTGLSSSVVKRLALNELFLWFDNAVVGFAFGRRELPSIEKGCRVYCKACWKRLTSVPCDCGAPANYGTGNPIDDGKRFRHQYFGLDSDRHWINQDRVSQSERAYHGESYGGF